MTHALSLPLPTTGLEMNFIRALRALPSATLPCFMAAVVFSTMAMAQVPNALWWDAAPQEAAAVLAPVRESGKAAKVRPVCEACGVVEAIHRVEPVGEMPASYELTVRMRDGSTRVSALANSAKWHAGDRIMLIGAVPASVK